MSRSKISIWNFVTRTVTHTYVHTLLVFIIGKIIPTRKTMDMCNAKCVCVFLSRAQQFAMCLLRTMYIEYSSPYVFIVGMHDCGMLTVTIVKFSGASEVGREGMKSLISCTS